MPLMAAVAEAAERVAAEVAVGVAALTPAAPTVVVVVVVVR